MDMTLGHTGRIIEICRKHGLLRNQAAYILATAFWETARTMEPVEEAFYLGAKAEAHRSKLRYYPWTGRGFVQLTWRANYEKASEALDVNLIETPDRALEPEIAAEILVRGCKEGWFTGKKLDDYITLQRSDFLNARKIVNGTDRQMEIAAIAKDYDAELKRMGYGEEPEAAPYDPLADLAAMEAALDRLKAHMESTA